MVLAMFSDSFVDSPFIVPVAGCAMILGIVVAGIWSGVRNREMQSQERLAAIAKGVPMPPTVEELALMHGRPTVDTRRRSTNSRTGGLACIGTGVGIILTCTLIAEILSVREVLCGAAAGLIPLAIGIGLLIDARIQSRELSDAANPAPGTPSSSEFLR